MKRFQELFKEILVKGFNVTGFNYPEQEEYPFCGEEYCFTTEETKICHHTYDDVIDNHIINVLDVDNYPLFEDIYYLIIEKGGQKVSIKIKNFNINTVREAMVKIASLIEEKRKDEALRAELSVLAQKEEEKVSKELTKFFLKWKGSAKDFYHKYCKKYYNTQTVGYGEDSFVVYVYGKYTYIIGVEIPYKK